MVQNHFLYEKIKPEKCAKLRTKLSVANCKNEKEKAINNCFNSVYDQQTYRFSEDATGIQTNDATSKRQAFKAKMAKRKPIMRLEQKQKKKKEKKIHLNKK